MDVEALRLLRLQPAYPQEQEVLEELSVAVFAKSTIFLYLTSPNSLVLILFVSSHKLACGRICGVLQGIAIFSVSKMLENIKIGFIGGGVMATCEFTRFTSIMS